jgi:hypothetical protein
VRFNAAGIILIQNSGKDTTYKNLMNAPAKVKINANMVFVKYIFFSEL